MNQYTNYENFMLCLSMAKTEKELFRPLHYAMIQSASTDPHEQDIYYQALVDAAYKLGVKSPRYTMEQWVLSHRDAYNKDPERFFQRALEAAKKDLDADKPPAAQRLSDLPTQPVSWLVPGLLPREAVSVLGADGGTGKGIWQAQLAAHITTGRANSFFPQPLERPGSVLIFSGEDDAGKVLRPRMLAAEADMERISVVESGSFYLSAGKAVTLDSPELAKLVRQAKPDLMILDPLQSFLPGKVDMASRNQMRSAITPFLGLCQELHAAGLLVMHTNKKGEVSGRQRLADSSDLWDMARSVLMMGRSKTDGLTYISHEKSSYAKAARTALFSIEDTVVEGVPVAKAVFHSYTTRKDADFVQERRARVAQTKEDAAEAILNTLAESRLGSMESARLKQAVLQETGCSERTYERAYTNLVKDGRVHKRPIRYKDGISRWHTFLYCGKTNDKV